MGAVLGLSGKASIEQAMKIRVLVAIVGLAIGFAAPIFAQPANTPDAQLRQKLVALFKNFDAAFSNNNIDAMAVDFTEDAVLVTTYGPIFGRQAIKQWYAELFKTVHASNVLSTVDPDSPHPIGTDHGAIWATGNWRATLQGSAGSVEAKGYWSAVGSREGEHWKIQMLCLNTPLLPAASPASTASPSSQ